MSDRRVLPSQDEIALAIAQMDEADRAALVGTLQSSLPQAATRNRSIDLLFSIDKTLKSILRVLAADAGGEIASDRDLDGKYGDPEVRSDRVKDWTGPSMKGRRYSECPPEFLDRLAGLLEWQGKKSDEENQRTDKGKLVGDYRRADAARARGWAKRMRDGKHPMPRIDDEDEDGFDVAPRF